MVTTTIKYRKRGVRPPVFVAGSFSDPEWVPREMNWVLDDRGESLFTTEIDVDADRNYQYKFKVGQGNDWDLDDQSPITSDDMGNQNNLLLVRSTPDRQDQSPQPQPETVQDSSNDLTSTSAQDGLPTVARSADRYGSLHLQDVPDGSLNDESSERQQTNQHSSKNVVPSLDVSLGGSRIGSTTEEEVIPSTPLFAHESLGAYDFDVVDDGFDHSLSPTTSRDVSASSFSAFGTFAPMIDETDFADPTLEKFPCDKNSVMNTLRRISTSTGEGVLPVDDRPSTSQLALRRTSVDSNAESLSSVGSLSPTSSRNRDSRLSHSSFGRTKSAASLGSIVEEPSRGANPAVAEMRSSGDSGNAIRSNSDEEGPEIRGVKLSPAVQSLQGDGAQVPSVVLLSQTPNKPNAEHESSKKMSRWAKEYSHEPVEGKWFVTGSVVLLALGIACWKSYHV